MAKLIRRRTCLLAAIVFLLAPPCALAQGYPTKPIRIVVPFVAGGSMDRLARILQTHMLESWGQPVVVDNRPGGGTVIGTELVSNASPDGYTLLMIANSAAINSTLRPKLPYDLLKDFSPISQLARTPHLLVVPASLKVNRLDELIALARARPGKLNYASIGPGSIQHLSGEMFKALAAIDVVHVPYAGTAPAVIAMLSGEVSMMFANVADVQQHVQTGRIKALAIASSRRQSSMEDIPTFIESGFSGFESSTWYGMVAPNGTPTEIVSKVNSEVLRIMQLPDVRETLATEGMQSLGTMPDTFRSFLIEEVDKYGRIVKAANLKVD
ncbi:Bug family tripartite tricarboxylate transporter substrate binding protein [Variovorax saccharolyticus]|uniref:Bug family tripartite tricarboxylate transporter substrate binding protein n=1 Tax=Variovorax saccharolyticus TaxID=3053516 RepID=UPI0025755B2B|nr:MULTISPECIES: tripartite tricarboxylate transporter substrate binding protein [unclassified Variovorax]MDM0020529.1 tripartite tricarboxylate transporter substrate binding protein [Variovorax sp. J22R187]MDM0025931.1 tripartite tricarboxylate transporter substrate binding protein [Variovorax sp. J31P216]